MKNCFKVLSLVLALTLIMSTVAFASTNLNPTITDPKPADYMGVAFYDDFEGHGDLLVNGSNYLTSRDKGLEVYITDVATGLQGGDHGKYAKLEYKITNPDATEFTNYFRTTYNNSPVDRAGYTLEDCKKMQISFDICAPSYEPGMSIQLWNNNGSTTGNEKEYIAHLNSEGKITFLNSDVEIDYYTNEWMSFDLYFDFTGTSGTYSAYLNGNAVVKDAPTNVLKTCVESIVLDSAAARYGNDPYYYYVDNYRIAVDSSKPADLETVIFFEDYNGDTEITAGDYNRDGVTNTIVNSTTAPGLTGSEGKGDFVKIDYVEGQNSYFRLEYTGSNSALDKSGYQVTDLGEMQVSFDICLDSADKDFNIRFYDQFSSGSTAADNLITFKNDGTIAFGTSNASVNYTANKWMSFDLYFDFTGTSGIYDVYIDGQRVASDVAISKTAIKCIEAFGSATNPNVTCTHYMDNLRIAMHEMIALESTNPEDGATGVALDSSYVATFNKNISSDVDDSDVEVSNMTADDYDVSVSDNQLTIDFVQPLAVNTDYTVTLKSTIANSDGSETLGEDITTTFKTAYPDTNTGYIDEIVNLDFEDFEAGDEIVALTDLKYDSTKTYFVRKNKTATVVQDGDAAHNMVAKPASDGYMGVYSGYANYASLAKMPSLIKAQIDIKKPSTKAIDIRYGNEFPTTYLMEVAASGAIEVFGNTIADDTFANDVWNTVTFYLNFNEMTCEVYLNNNLLAKDVEIPEEHKSYNNGQFFVNCNTTGTGDVFVDNIIVSTADVLTDRHSGYTDEIANFTFEDKTVGDTITSSDSAYYVKEDYPATIVADPQGIHGKVASITGTDTGNFAALGVSNNKVTSHASYVRNNDYPTLVKAEVEFLRTASVGAYIYATNDSGTKQELMLYSGSSNNLQFSTEGASRTYKTTETYGLNTWIKVTLYFDFETGKYHIYIDDAYHTTLTIPAAISGIKEIYFGAGNNALVDNFSLSTIPAFGANVVSEFTNMNGETKFGYAYKNAGTEATDAMLVIADYEGEKTMLQAVAGQTNIPAGKMRMVTVNSLDEKADGATRVVYLWNGFETLVPLIEPFEL